MNPELRKKLQVIRERIEKAIGHCNQCDRQIADITRYLTTVGEGAKESEVIAAAIPAIAAIAQAKIKELEAEKAAYDSMFDDLV